MQHGLNTDLLMTSRIINDIFVTYDYGKHKHFYYNTNILIIVIWYVIYKPLVLYVRFASCYALKVINSVQGNFVMKGLQKSKLKPTVIIRT